VAILMQEGLEPA